MGNVLLMWRVKLLVKLYLEKFNFFNYYKMFEVKFNLDRFNSRTSAYHVGGFHNNSAP